MTDYIKIKNQFISELEKITDLFHLNEIRVSFLGKNGIVSNIMHSISKVSSEERKIIGIEVNSLRDFILNELSNKKTSLEKKEILEKLKVETIDISLPGRYEVRLGKKHLISQAISEIKSILEMMGFNEASGPEIEDDWHNFTALNIAELHPARQAHDTFYIENKNQSPDNNLLLRTHTSSMQIRYMKNNKPPIKTFSIGKVYRADHDATHTPMFHQVEVMYIDKSITFAHLKEYLTQILQLFFETKELNFRFRSSYFPFTEPSMEVDIEIIKQDPNGIKKQGWLEVLGCGMVHNNVLSNTGISPDEYQGFALGLGIERLAMLKYKIKDLRNFFENDIRWLRYYGI